ncbi:MAG: D-2-hydroxyacid dehydrogenase [Pirellulaceae bacterium]
MSQIRSVAPHAEIIDAGQERVAAELFEADIFCGHAKVPVPWDEIVARRRLRWIQSSAAGMDHCLVPSVIRSNILVTSASGLFADQVAEQTLVLLLGVLRDLPTFFRQQQRREFVRRTTADLTGTTVGIVGFGGNGRRIAEVLQPFRTRILATDLFPRTPVPGMAAVWPAERLDEMLAQVDVVILCVPLNPQTHGMFDAQRLGRLKRGAVLINVARGPVVVEADLIQALRSGQLAGAGLDVTETEPLPSDSPLWDMPRVLITPHVGAQSASRYDDVTDFFSENLCRYLAQEPLWNVVDRQLGFPVEPAVWTPRRTVR